MLVETALALFFPALCILIAGWKIMHGPIPINSRSPAIARTAFRFSGVNLTPPNARFDEVVHDGY